MAVTETAMEALGVERFGIIGNCLGAKTAVTIAARASGCVSVAAIFPEIPWAILVGEGRPEAYRLAQRISRKMPRLSNVVRRTVHPERLPPRMRFIPEVQATLRASSLLLLLLGTTEVGRKVEEGLARLEIGSNGKPPVHAQVRTIPAEGTAGFQLAVPLQEVVIEAVCSWMDGTIDNGPGAASENAGSTTPVDEISKKS